MCRPQPFTIPGRNVNMYTYWSDGSGVSTIQENLLQPAARVQMQRAAAFLYTEGQCSHRLTLCGHRLAAPQGCSQRRLKACRSSISPSTHRVRRHGGKGLPHSDSCGIRPPWQASAHLEGGPALQKASDARPDPGHLPCIPHPRRNKAGRNLLTDAAKKACWVQRLALW